MSGEWGVVGKDESGRWTVRGAVVALIFGALFSVLGLAFAGVGAGTALTTKSFLSRSVAAQGLVTELHEKRDTQNHSVTFAPVFSFVARDGRSYSIESHSASNPPGFAVGDTVRVLYDPADPAGAKIDSPWQLWGISMVFGGVGTVFALTGITMMLIGWIQKRRGSAGWTMRSK